MNNEHQKLEEAAALAHEQWSGWMKFLFRHCVDVGEGALKILPQDVERWKRQMHTPYLELPENEKESDRIEARKFIELLAVPEERI